MTDEELLYYIKNRKALCCCCWELKKQVMENGLTAIEEYDGMICGEMQEWRMLWKSGGMSSDSPASLILRRRSNENNQD